MKFRLVPASLALAVASLSTLLLVIGARSPYTHANLVPSYSAGYSRTEQSLVGPPRPFAGTEVAVEALDPVQRGKALFVAKGCASCHFLNGRGGVVGPPIVGAGVPMLREKVYKGPGGMPAYSPETLSEEDLSFIALYLQALKEDKVNP